MAHDAGGRAGGTLELVVVTPLGEAFAGPVERVVLPGSEGQLGVLRGHEPFLTAIRAGDLELLEPGGRLSHLEVSEGFARVEGDRVVLLVGACRAAVTSPGPGALARGRPTP